jgi:hypothetical protein
MIWHQGEADATTTLYPTYQSKLKIFFEKVRTDLNKSNLPIVAGELGTFLAANSTYPRWDSINVQINRLNSVLSNYAVVSSTYLTANSDMTHFNTASILTFGTRYANEFFSLHPYKYPK